MAKSAAISEEAKTALLALFVVVGMLHAAGVSQRAASRALRVSFAMQKRVKVKR